MNLRELAATYSGPPKVYLNLNALWVEAIESSTNQWIHPHHWAEHASVHESLLSAQMWAL